MAESIGDIARAMRNSIANELFDAGYCPSRGLLPKQLEMRFGPGPEIDLVIKFESDHVNIFTRTTSQQYPVTFYYSDPDICELVKQQVGKSNRRAAPVLPLQQ